VNRRLTQRDDGRYGLSHLPDHEFIKYETIARRTHQRNTVYVKKPFYDLFHNRLYQLEDTIHSARYPNSNHLSIPYANVEYSFNLWGETYRHEFDVLYRPSLRLDRRRISTSHGKGFEERGKQILVHVLSFIPPDEEILSISLPSTVMIFDVNRMVHS
jgi:hypothetical protein